MSASPRTYPAPKGQFIWGQATEFNRDQLRYAIMMARDFGDIVPIRLFTTRVVFFNRPELVEQILVTKQRSFIKSIAFRRLSEMTGNGLITSDGDFWRRQHRLVQPGFHRERVEGFAQAMVEQTTHLLGGWHDRETREIQAEMMRVTLEIVCRTMFGADVSGSSAEIGATFTEAIDAVNRRVSSVLMLVPRQVPFPHQLRIWRATRRLDRLVYGLIRDRKASGGGSDLLAMLLEARDELNGALSDREVRNEVMTIAFAGHETTACALTWAWYLLAQHPEVEQRLHAELDAVLGGRPPTVADLPHLTYTSQIVMETLRLYPPVWILVREAIEDVEIGDYTVRKGDVAMVSQWTIHRDRRQFERPEAFEPERWADGLVRRLPRFSYFPFGGGPRICLGNTFAQMEATLVLASVAQQYRLRLVPVQSVEPLGGITLRAKHGIRMTLHRRD